MHIDIKKLRGNKSYPTGKDFYKLFKSVLGSNIKDFPMIKPEALNYDPDLYVAVVAYVYMLMGKNNKLIKSGVSLVKGDAVQSLRRDTYGTYSENNSRLYCYKWVVNNK